MKPLDSTSMAKGNGPAETMARMRVTSGNPSKYGRSHASEFLTCQSVQFPVSHS